MIASINAGILALLSVWLSLNVIKLRRSKKVILGDGDETDLQNAIRAQGNATKYIPIAIILLMLLELSRAHVGLVHAGGVALVMSRVIHAHGLLTQNQRYRILGMQITFFTIIGLASINICYGIYNQLVGA